MPSKIDHGPRDQSAKPEPKTSIRIMLLVSEEEAQFVDQLANAASTGRKRTTRQDAIRAVLAEHRSKLQKTKGSK